MTHISVLFMYYVTKFFVQGNSIQQRVSIAIVISWWRKRKQFHRSEWLFSISRFCTLIFAVLLATFAQWLISITLGRLSLCQIKRIS